MCLMRTYFGRPLGRRPCKTAPVAENTSSLKLYQHSRRTMYIVQGFSTHELFRISHRDNQLDITHFNMDRIV